MLKRHSILPTRATFFILSAGKIETAQEFKIKLFGDDSHVKIVWLYVAVFNKNGTLYF